MLTERPRRIRLDRPIFFAVTFPSFAEFTVDQCLRMPAVMGFGPDAVGEVSGVDHTNKSSPVGGAWRGLFIGI